MNSISFQLKEAMHLLCQDDRWNVLTVLMLHSNIRNRCWPSMDIITAMGCNGNRARATRAKKWLVKHQALELVPAAQRHTDEKHLPPRQHVYQLTGVIQACNDAECDCGHDGRTYYYFNVQDLKSFDGETIKNSTVENFDGETRSNPKASNPIKETTFASPHGNAAGDAINIGLRWNVAIWEMVTWPDTLFRDNYDKARLYLSDLLDSGKINPAMESEQVLAIVKQALIAPPTGPAPEKPIEKPTPKKWSLKDHVIKIWGPKNEGMAGALLAQMLGITKRNGKRKEYNFEEPLYDEYELWGFRYWWRATFPDIKDMPTAAETLFERFAQFRGDPEYTQHCGMGKYAVEKMTGQTSEPTQPTESKPTASEPAEPKLDRSKEIQEAVAALSEQFRA